MCVRSFEELGGTGPGNGNDCWGWVFEGREFVLFGRSDGTSIVEITDPVNPVMLADVATASVPSLWRDIKVIGDVAFIVSEAGEHGMQVVDLTQVPAMETMGELGTLAWYTGFGGAHNIVANPETNFVYGVGTDTFNGGLHIVDVSDPSNPTLVGAWDEAYIHDAQVVNYNGPDLDYQGKELAFVFSGFSGFHIVDVEDKSDCQTLSSLAGPEWIYPHQGWLTEDHRFVLMNDEMDEAAGIAPQTRTWILDVQDLDNPVILGYHEGTLSVTDHNLYTHEGKVYEANYYAGIQVLEIQDLANLAMQQVAFFDTNPFSNQAGTGGGAWSVYPYFESGNIAISTQSHMFVVRPSEGLNSVWEPSRAPSLHIWSESGRVHIQMEGAADGPLLIFDAKGRRCAEWPVLSGRTSTWFVPEWPAGVYVARTKEGLQRRFILQ
jgi:choice-of-anchor B domain-containing protein